MKQTFWRPTQAYINLSALRHNLTVARSLTQAKLVAVVKANGYGHGLNEAASALKETDAFAVATLDEALSVRAVIPTQDILVLQGFYDSSQLNLFNEQRLIPVVHSSEQLEMLHSSNAPLRIVLEYNSGMNRLGLSHDQLHKAIASIQAHPHQQIFFIMTHFRSANRQDPHQTYEQLKDFRAAMAGITLPSSLCNSAALLNFPEARADYDRPGLMLYGASPLDARPAADIGLKPVMTLASRLIAVHQLKEGDEVGYEGIWRAPRDCRVGTIPLGYGDGYPRIVHNDPIPVLVKGSSCVLSGRVSMDLLSVDLSNCEDAKVGDEVIFWGEGLPLDEVAQATGRLAYDLLAGLTARLPRIYE